MKNGQALVVLLFYMVIAITLTTGAVALTITNSMTTMQEEEGNHALEVAESGAENAILRLLRNRGFTGETISVENGTAVATVSGTINKTIVSVGTVGTMKRTVRVVVSVIDGMMKVTSWREL
jgi:hypothetical protein